MFMLAKKPHSVRAVLECPCPACIGSGFDDAGGYCVACKGAGRFELEIEEDSFGELLSWDDGPAWDAVVTKLQAAGAEIHDDSPRSYIADDAVRADDGTYTITLKLWRSPVSAETAVYFNRFNKGSKQ